MALDHALAMASRPGEGVVRLYQWASPTVSFGRNEPARGVYDAEEGARRGVAFVRRPTGGRAVLHDAELTYAVVAPDRTLGGPRGLYRKVHEGLALGLRLLGIDARVEDGGAALTPDAGPCFKVPAPGEIVAAGRKLVGSAQVRLGSALLQHGSVILDGDQSLLLELAGGAVEVAAPATVRELAGEVPVAEVADALLDGLERALGGRWEVGTYRSGELADADWLEKERYADAAWTWSR